MPKVNPPLIAIIGPTASGKSKLALRLAKQFHGVVLSADSQQLYRGAKIGTNQPAGKWQVKSGKKKVFTVQGVPHFFIDTLSPRKQFSAAEFQKQAYSLLKRFHPVPSTLSPLPFLVGGTPLYISAVVEGYRFPDGKPKVGLRKKLEQKTLPTLLAELKQRDPQTHQHVDRKNKRRVVRALEYVLSTGQSFAAAQTRQARPNTLILGLSPSKAKLRQDITRRARAMLKRGLVRETQTLLRRYPKSPLLQSLGYRECVSFLMGKLTQNELESAIAAHTWQYARRQLRWFKRLPNVRWVKNAQDAERAVRQFLRTVT